jgi:hypothetical protein
MVFWLRRKKSGDLDTLLGNHSYGVFLNQPVLLSTFYYASNGPDISASLTDIAAALAAEGESLTYIDFGGTP